MLALLWLLAGPVRGAPPVICPGCDCDGHCLSGPCNCNEPLDDESARQLLDYMVSLAVRVCGDQVRMDPPPVVRVTGPEGLQIEGHEVALGTSWEGEIRLGRWLRRPEALVVLAHEYGHAWQDRCNPQAHRLTERFSEGFASWMAQVVARQTGYQTLADHFRRRSGPVYQEGFQAFQEWERTLGPSRLLYLARTWVDFTGEGAPVPTAGNKMPGDQSLVRQGRGGRTP